MVCKFSEIIGQDKAKEILKRTVGRDRMSHAYLFRGVVGIGKKTTAQAFAALINCLAPVNHEACGKCGSCRKLYAGSHPDFMVIEPDGIAIKINQIRALKHALIFPPFEALYRVVLLADIHTMRREAANSLLKTLEEPPINTVLILTADESNVLLPTIVSRCQVVPFFALSYSLIAEVLRAENDISFNEGVTLAAGAEGSLGRARLLLSKNLLPMHQQITDKLLYFAADCPAAVIAILELAEEVAGFKKDINELFDLLKIWFRDIIFYISGAVDFVSHSELLPTFQVAEQRWTREQLVAKLALINQAQKQLQRHCNRKLVCEVLFFSLL